MTVRPMDQPATGSQRMGQRWVNEDVLPVGR